MSAGGFQFGDVLFVKSYGFLSRLIRLLISIRYGLPLKYAWSHVFMAISDEEGISAEASGVEIVKLRGDPSLIKADVVGYRFLDGIDGEQEEAMQRTINTLAGKGYGYARYALDFLRVGAFYLFLLALVPAALRPSSLGPWYLGAVAVFIVLEKILARFDLKSFDCSETTSLILTAGGLWRAPATRSRSEFPDGMFQTFKVLELHGSAIEILNKRPGDEL